MEVIAPKKSIGHFWRSHSLFVVVTVSAGFFSETFLYGVVVPVLPFILRERVGSDNEKTLQWWCSLLLTVYSASSFILSPVAGAIADGFSSRKTPFLLALMLMGSSVMTFFTTESLLVLILARCAQGAGTAIIWTVGFSMCFEAVGVEHMGKTLGMVMSIGDFGAFISPALGGLMYTQFGIWSIDSVCTAIVSMALVMSLWLIEKEEIDSDLARAPLLGAGQGLSYDAHRETPQTEEPTILVPGEFMLPLSSNKVLKFAPILRCFANPSFIVAIILCGVNASLLAAFDATIPLQAKELFSFDPLNAGLLFIPMACSRLIAGPIGGWMVDKHSPRLTAVFGYSFLVPALVALRFVNAEPRGMEIQLYCLLLTLCGIGIAIVATPSFVETSYIVDRYHQANPGLFGNRPPIGALYGMYLSAFGAGSSLGPILAGGLRNRIGYGNMNAVLAGITGISALISYIWMRRKPDLSEGSGVEESDA